MSPYDRQRLFGSLMLVSLALFVSSGTAVPPSWRRWLRGGAVAIFALAVLAALVEVALWLRGAG
jgi:hypothetical protein